MRPTLTRKEAYAFTRRAYRILRSECDAVFLTKIPGEVRLDRKTKQKRIINVAGHYEWDEEDERRPVNTSISIDYRFDIIPTIIHELLHIMHPSWNEKDILVEERKFVRGLSQRQIRNLLVQFVDAIKATNC